MQLGARHALQVAIDTLQHRRQQRCRARQEAAEEAERSAARVDEEARTRRELQQRREAGGHATD